MRRRPLTVMSCDGSPGAARAVWAALGSALDGNGPAVLPVRAGGNGPPAAMRPDEPATDPGARGVPVRARAQRVLAALRPDGPVDERVALVVATSGSTGQPKGVELTASALLASAVATHERLGGTGRWLLALPVQHIAGAQVLVRSLIAGHEPAVLDLRAGFTADAFAQVARAMRASGRGKAFTALVPTQLVRLLDAGGAALDELRGFDAVLVGGAACPPAVLERSRELGIAVVTTYGMTETAGGCVYDGRPLRGVRVRIAGGHIADGRRITDGGRTADGRRTADEGRSADAQHTADAQRTAGGGRIELAGPTLALGYRLDAAATAAAFADGWFRTDDCGRLSEDGLLEAIGRLDDMIVTGGHKVAPALVERALAAAPGVAEACVIGLPDAHWGELVAAAVVAIDPTAPPDVEALRAVARELAGPAAAPKLIQVVNALPYRGPGKIDRAAVRRLLAPDTQP